MWMVITLGEESRKTTSRISRDEEVSFQTNNDRALNLCHAVFLSLGTGSYKGSSIFSLIKVYIQVDGHVKIHKLVECCNTVFLTCCLFIK